MFETIQTLLKYNSLHVHNFCKCAYFLRILYHFYMVIATTALRFMSPNCILFMNNAYTVFSFLKDCDKIILMISMRGIVCADFSAAWRISFVLCEKPKKAGIIRMNKATENNTYISLLFPDAKYEFNADGIKDEDANQLELYTLLDLHRERIGSFFTDVPEVIRYRQKTFEDLRCNPKISEILLGMLPFLTDITELRRINAGGIGDDYLYSISEIEIYVSLMKMLKDELLPYADKVASPALKRLCSRIGTLIESEYFKDLSENLGALASRVRDIRSITVGINLDGSMSPESCGVVSINSEKFKSGEFFDKVRRLDFKKDDMTCIAELIPYSKGQPENQRLAMINAAGNAVSDVFKTSIKSWKKVIRGYVIDNTDFLIRMIPEIEFITRGAELIKKLEERGCPLCIPEITEDNSNYFSAKGLCNPVIALKTDSELVPNDIAFDESAMIYVITGPNRGGKSVITCAVGHAFAMAQLGLPVAAESASISPCDKILTHFPTGSEDTVEKGRLGEECARLCKIFDSVTDKSLVLLDESLSSTGSYEGAYIAAEVLQGFSMARLRGIFSTHLHDLAASVDKINSECLPRGGVAIDNLVAEVTDGRRSFKIVRKTPDGKSYARDIAEKYGLSIDSIMKKINKQ